MKAFCMKKIGEVGWVDKPVPECGPIDALVKPVALAPCTSDIHTVWEGAVGERTDLTLGHEAVGEVVEVGSLVKDFKPGDTVIIPAITPDWNSLEAQAGYGMHSGGMLGGWKFSNIKDGVFAEVFHVNDADGNMALLPEGIDPGVATMLCDMMPTGFQASELAEIGYGDSVCVIGIGPVGLMCVASAVLKGAGRVFAVGTRPDCVRVAKEYGATDIISYKDGDIDAQVLELTGGKGVDKVLIAGGTVDTFAEAIRMLKPGGILSNVNYLGSGEYVKIPRAEWGVGMGHKAIQAGLMQGGRLRMEKLAQLLVNNR
ncbi:MAG: NAD(P)-dependent alcohol dehydrogenase, partial [Coriobacteriia bacterium]|nr:NAD(P)-dependent alcohol dehydrogenase [Coriobacteriia bacterium]